MVASVCRRRPEAALTAICQLSRSYTKVKIIIQLWTDSEKKRKMKKLSAIDYFKQKELPSKLDEWKMKMKDENEEVKCDLLF